MIPRRLIKNRKRSGDVVEYIRGRGGTCEVSRDERARVSPVTNLINRFPLLDELSLGTTLFNLLLIAVTTLSEPLLSNIIWQFVSTYCLSSYILTINIITLIKSIDYWD